MRRHTRIMLFMLLVMLLALTECEKTYTGKCRYADIIRFREIDRDCTGDGDKSGNCA